MAIINIVKEKLMKLNLETPAEAAKIELGITPDRAKRKNSKKEILLISLEYLLI